MQSPYRGLDEDIFFEVDIVVEVLAQGLHASVRKGDGVAYVGDRDFEEGDPLQHVDVPRSIEKSPKFDDLVLRLFEPERQLRICIILDATRGMEVPLQKCRIACALLWIGALASFRRGDEVTVYVVFDKEEGGIRRSPPLRSEDDLNLFITMLQDNSAWREESECGLDVLEGMMLDDTVVFVISDFLRDAFLPEDVARRIPRKKNARLILALLDEWDDESLPPALAIVFDPVTGAYRKLDGRPGRELDSLRRTQTMRQSRVVDMAHAAGHIAVRIPLFRSQPFDELVRVLAENTEKQLLP